MRIPIRFVALGLLLAEVAVFVLVSRALGTLATFGLTLALTLAGFTLLRRQGFAAVARIKHDLNSGRIPSAPLADAAVLPLAAVLIALPGFITSVAGLLLFVPPIRSMLLTRLERRWRSRRGRPRGFGPAGAQIDLREGEYVAAPRPGASQRQDSPWRSGDIRSR